MEIRAHNDPANSVAFLPDGQWIASASRDGTIHVWDAITGEIVVGQFIGHTSGIVSVAFSPDRRRIASASHDCTIRMWDATSGEVYWARLLGTDAVRSVAFSPDGQRSASASDDRTIRIWDAATGEVVVNPFTGHRLGLFCYILAGWPAHCLGLKALHNSHVGCHNGRGRSESIYWPYQQGQVCCILAKRAAHRLGLI
jgi:WD40 repeat protein